MKTHYTAKELAGLPGLNITERAIQIRADRENWPWQKRSGRGGGREYPITALPAETREYIARQSIVPAVKQAAVPATISKTATINAPAQLKQWQRNCMDARVAIMRLVERAAPLVGVNKAILTIVKASVNGELEELSAANARKGANRAMSYDGIMKWWQIWKKSNGNCMALAPKDVENYLEPVWAPSFMACWSRPQKPCLTEVLDEYAKVAPTGMGIPTYGQARHYLKKLGMIERETGRKTGNELKALKPFRRRDTTDMYPGDAYTADGHCFDGEVAHPFTGRPFRPEITPVIDVATRKVVGWSCDLAESGLAVLDALRAACENHGVPAIFYTDNGSGYKNQMMTAPGTGILNRLDITPEYSRPRNPQAHGLSERAHQSILIKAAKQLCTYIGSHMDNDVAQLVYKKTRKDIKTNGYSALLIEWDDFLNHVNTVIEKYNNTPHRGLPAVRDAVTRTKTHLTPNQAWELGLERMHRELPELQWLHPANELPDLYHPAVERTVIRGEIQLGTLTTGLPKRYFNHDLKQWHGHRVQVAFSPSDASRVWVRDLEQGRLLAVAQLGGNSDDYFAQSYKEEKRIKRGYGRLKRLEVQADDARLEMHGPASVIIEHSPEIQREHLRIAQKIQDADIAEKAVFVAPVDEQSALRCWQAMDDRKRAGETLPADQEGWWRSWQNNKTCKAWLALRGEL